MSGKSLVGWDPAAALLIGDSMARQPLSLKIYLLGSKDFPTGSRQKHRNEPLCEAWIQAQPPDRGVVTLPRSCCVGEPFEPRRKHGPELDSTAEITAECVQRMMAADHKPSKTTADNVVPFPMKAALAPVAKAA